MDPSSLNLPIGGIMRRQACPEPEQLRGLLQGTLAAEVADSVAQHLDACENCRSAVEDKSVLGGSLVSMLQGASQKKEAKPGSVTTMPANYRELARVALDETEGFAPGSSLPLRRDETPARLGHFRIIRQIGRGGMGVVFEAEQTALGRIVALKILPSEMFRRRNAVERFQREAASAASLHHTNIVPVFEVGEADGTWFYAMQLINGAGLDVVRNEIKRFRSQNGWETANGGATVAASSGRKSNRRLDAAQAQAQRAADVVEDAEESDDSAKSIDVVEVLSTLAGARGSTDDVALATQPNASRPALTEPQFNDKQKKSLAAFSNSHFRSVAEIGRQAASALHHAHQRGIVHRDVKPSNLLLDHEGIVWLTDFGLAKQSDDGLTGEGEAPGTLRYMAPERFKGESTPASDIYALGVTLYELLTLGPVFSATDHVSLIQQIREFEPTDPKRLDRSVPFDLQTIIQKAMAKDSTRRYRTAQAMEEDLAAYLDGQPISARRVGALERLWLWSKNHKALSASLAALAILTLAIACGSSMAAVHFREQKNKEAKLAAANLQLANEKSAESKQAARQRDAAYLHAYFADMRQAHQDWKNGQMQRMLSTLRRYLPSYPSQDVRGWEWFYLLSLAHQDAKTMLDHDGSVTQVAWSPDGSRLISLSTDTLILWDENGDRLKKINLPGVRQFAFNGDGSQFATVSGDAIVRIWDTREARLDDTIETEFPALASIDWSRNGNRIAVTRLSPREPGLLVLDAKTKATISNKTLSIHAPIRGVKFSSDGKYLGLLFLGRNFDVFDVETQRFLYSAKFSAVGRFRDLQAMCFAWHPDSRRFAVGAFQNGARVFEIENDGPLPKELGVFQDDASVDAICFTPDGNGLVVGNRAQRIDCFDLKTGLITRSLKGHLSALRSASHHPSRDLLATGADDGALKFWAILADDAKQPEGAFDARIESGSFADDRYVWKQVAKSIVITDKQSGSEVADLKGVGPVTHARYFPESQRLFLAYRHGNSYIYGLDRMWVVDASNWKLEQSLKSRAGGYPSAVQRGDFAASSNSGFATVFNGQDGTVRRFRPHTGMFALDLSPDGALLATCSYGEVAVWDTESGAELARCFGHRPNGYMPTIHWGNQGKLLATGSIDQTIKIWDARAGQCLQTLQGLQGAPLHHFFGFSQDDTRFMAAGPQNLKVWDVQSGRELLSFELAALKSDTFSLFHQFRTIPTTVGFRLPASVLGFESLAKYEALRDNRKGIERFQHQSQYALARELLLHASDEKSQHRGLQLARNALRQDPANTAYLLAVGLGEYLQQNDEAAVKTLKLADASGLKESPELYFLLAGCWKRMGKPKEMQAALLAAGKSLSSTETVDLDVLPLINRIAAACIEESTHRGAEHIVVNTLDDVIDGTSDGKVSLREAILLVRDGGRITIGASGVIQLKLGVLKIGKSLSLSGPGSGQLTIDGAERFRILAVEDDNPAKRSKVQLSGLTLTRGFASGEPTGGPSSEHWNEPRGGCVFSSESLTISDCVLENSVLPNGVGGAMYVNQYSDVRLQRCTIRSNSSAGGGAFYISGDSEVHVDGCTFFDNSTVGLGGALRMMGVTTMVNSTFSANSASRGGAIFITESAAGSTIEHCTFALNRGAAIELVNNPALAKPNVLKIGSSLFSDNKLHASEDVLDIATNGAACATLHYSLFTKITGDFSEQRNNIVGLDAQLGPLKSNGGPTRTHGLAPGSPAIDAAAPATSAFDQRGEPFARSVDGDGKGGPQTDIGAFELQRD